MPSRHRCRYGTNSVSVVVTWIRGEGARSFFLNLSWVPGPAPSPPFQVYPLVVQDSGCEMSVENGNNLDAFEAFRGVRDAYLDAFSKVMIKTVNTEEYAKASGAMLDGYMTMLAPMREVMDKTMVVALENLSLPSRQQVVSLAERFTNLEIRFDDLDAKLDRLIALSTASISMAGAPAVQRAETPRPKAQVPLGAQKSR